MKKATAFILIFIMLAATLACGERPQAPLATPAPTQEAYSEPPATAEPTETTQSGSAPILPLHLKEGDESPVVANLQKRLMDLNYMDSDEPTELFSDSTTEAVKRFQRRNGLEVTGRVEDGDYSVLMSSRAAVYTPGPGDEGEDITAFQERLHELGYLEEITGVFDGSTGDAVLLFQQKNGLEEDGMLNAVTAEYLYYESTVPNAPDPGSQSEQVLKYQQRLYELGYLLAEPDGFYGSETLSAVKRFQGRNGLIADGYLGPTAAACLMGEDARFNTLEYTMSGDDVLRLQTRLAALNYLKEQEANGYFGMATETAVRSFQHNNGLDEDGTVSKQTRDLLFSNRAKPADANHPVLPGPGQTLRPTAVPTNTPRPSATLRPGSLASVRIRNLIETAYSKLGCPYIRGAKGPDNFDCSGFVYWCLNRSGVLVGYMTSYNWRTTNLFPRVDSFSDVREGDILVFEMGPYNGHVAIAIGGGKMIDASSNTGRVVCRSYNTAYWRRVFCCAYRVFTN